MIPIAPWDVLGVLGSAIGESITHGWVTMMLGLWSASLWLLGLVMGFLDATLQPDIRLDGPAGPVYAFSLAVGVSLAGLLSLVQAGVALFRRDGRSVGRLLVGVAQFWLFLSGGLLYAAAVLTAASALTRWAMQVLFGVSTWREWQPWIPFSLQDVTDAVMATVLGLLSGPVHLASVGLFLIMVVRSAALVVMAATSPIAAAGLVSELGHTWLWRVCRWFHVAAFTPLLVVLVMGIGIGLANGITAGLAEGVAASVGSAFAATVLIATATFSPLALFKLLAFIEPGTASGASARAGWAAIGGLQGLIRGGSNESTTSSAASTRSASGASQGEGDAQSSTAGRVSASLPGLGNTSTASAGNGPAAQQGGGQGQNQPQQPSLLDRARGGLADGLESFASLGAQGAALGADVTNQAGVGHNNYYPDFAGASARSDNRGQVAHQHNSQQQANGQPQPNNNAPPQATTNQGGTP